MPRGQDTAGRSSPEGNEYEQSIIRSLRMLIRSISGVSRQLANEAGITILELLCLRRVVEFPPTTAGEIARDVHMDAAKVIGVTDRLEEKGLIRRERSEHGRRRVLLTATGEGMALYEDIRYPIQTLFRTQVKKHLSRDDYERIAKALEDIVNALGAGQEDGETPLTSIGPVDPGRH